MVIYLQCYDSIGLMVKTGLSLLGRECYSNLLLFSETAGVRTIQGRSQAWAWGGA